MMNTTTLRFTLRTTEDGPGPDVGIHGVVGSAVAPPEGEGALFVNDKLIEPGGSVVLMDGDNVRVDGLLERSGFIFGQFEDDGTIRQLVLR